MSDEKIRNAVIELLNKDKNEIATILGADLQCLYNTLDEILFSEENND